MLSEYISTENIIFDLESSEKEEAFAELLEVLKSQKKDLNREFVMNALVERESKMSTAVIPHIAVPHAVINSVDKTLIAIGISKNGIPFENIEEGQPENIVNVIFEIIFSEDDSQSRLHLLRDILKITSNPEFYQKVMNARNPHEILELFHAFE